jgi:hypothetical protein
MDRLRQQRLFFYILVLIGSLAAPINAAEPAGSNRSSIGMYLFRSVFSALEFRRPHIQPQPSITFAVVNATFLPSADCYSALANGSITGVGWEPSLVRSEGILSLTRPQLTPAPVASVTLAPPVSHSPSSFSSNIDDTEMLIYATPAFTGTGKFRLRLPGNCTLLGLEFGVDFEILSEMRTGLGKFATFCVLMMGAFGAVLALLGSPTLLTLAQLLALLSLSNCGSLAVQEESLVLCFLLVPMAPAFTSVDSCNRLLAAMLLVSCACVLELSREGLERVLAPAPSSSSAPPPLPLATGAPPPPYPGVLVAQRARPARGFARIVGRRPLPPHFALVFFIGLYPGMLFYGIRTVSDANSMIFTGVGLVGMAVAGLGPVVGALRIVRHPTVFFCDYHAAGLPRYLMPFGVWGPTKFRQQFGTFINDFTRGKKGFSPVLSFVVVVLACACSAVPTELKTCQSQFAIILLISVVLFVAAAFARPFRSPVLNITLTASIFAVALFSLFQFMFVWYFSSERTHWSISGALVCCVVAGAVGVLGGTCHMFLLILEVVSSMAVEAVRRETIDRTRPSARQTHRGGFWKISSVRRPAELSIESGELEQHVNGTLGGVAAGDSDVSEQMVSKMMMEVVAHHHNDQVRWRGDFRTAVVDGDAHQPSLADYLLQDYAELPQETRDDFATALEAEERQRQRQILVEPMLVHPSDRPVSFHVRQPVEPRARPPYVQAVTLNERVLLQRAATMAKAAAFAPS